MFDLIILSEGERPPAMPRGIIAEWLSSRARGLTVMEGRANRYLSLTLPRRVSAMTAESTLGAKMTKRSLYQVLCRFGITALP